MAYKTRATKLSFVYKATDGVIARICPVCKKVFVPAPQHSYKFGRQRSAPLVCSWSCARASEKVSFAKYEDAGCSMPLLEKYYAKLAEPSV